MTKVPELENQVVAPFMLFDLHENMILIRRYEYININSLMELLSADLYLVGSRIVCDPAVYDTDVDIIVNPCLSTTQPDMIQCLLEERFTSSDNGSYPDDNFTAYRKDNINVLLLTEHNDGYNSNSFLYKFLRASTIAKLLNLKDKQDRIKLHQYIEYGVINV